MSLSRRDFLRLSSLATALTATAGCRTIGRQIASGDLPTTIPTPPTLNTTTTPTTTTTDPLQRFLHRAGFGPRPGDYHQAAQLGLPAYLEQQLDHLNIDNTATDLMIANLDHYHMDASQLASADEHDVIQDLLKARIRYALYSKRQLYEVMVEFWSDHFSIFLRKNKQMPMLKTIDDRDVIRPHALGKFRDLLFASAQSPAMLVYLDNIRNIKTEPNENYARELLELHTLGVTAGYTQQDVQEVARAFTGWTTQRRRGQFQFREQLHDNGRKQILDLTLMPGQGQNDGFKLLEMLATHPSTAHFIATKLVRRFVADEPPTDLVTQVAQTFLDSDGDIKSMLRLIFLSPHFAAAPPKLKRPLTFTISTLRALHADVADERQIIRWAGLMGQQPFMWPAPDGYPDVSTAWTNNLLARWNFSLLTSLGRLPGVTIPFEKLAAAGQVNTTSAALTFLSGLIWGRALTAAETTLFTDYIGDTPFNQPATRQKILDCAGLMLAVPQFQWT
ncbi:MAG TPA: DUF1800 family protein [Anaerolineae bacterium]|nr:DUF1800 family protein [Anaerolineae bacterium]